MCEKTLIGHKKWICSIAKLGIERIVSCSESGTVKIWDLETRNCLQTLGEHDKSMLGAIVLDDSRIVCKSANGEILIFELAEESLKEKEPQKKS